MSNPDFSPARCGSVIVTYNPDANLFEQQLHAVQAQVGSIIVVDNGSSEATKSRLLRFREEIGTLRIEFLPSNKGIAFAQNLGTRRLLEANDSVRYVLFLDHDSVPSSDLVFSLYRHAEKLQAEGIKLAAVGARLIDPRSGDENGFYVRRNFLWGRIRCGERPRGAIPCTLLNSSGSFHPIESLQDVGPFDETMFVDLIDTDWCFRARRAGYETFGVCDGQLNHYMGESVVRYWLFGWHSMPRRTPLRHYYIVRNSLTLYRRSYVPLSWILSNVLKLLFTLAYFSVFDPDRAWQFRMIARGVLDAIRRRTGIYPDYLFLHK
jgi:rhamnosyltransferase